MSVLAGSRPQARGWIALTGMFAVANFVEIILYSNLAAFTPVYLQSIGFDDESIRFWTGFLASVGMMLGFWFVPMWGVLADRHGRKPLIVRSFAIEVVACVIMAFAPSIWFFMLGRMLTGLALGNTGLMLASISERTPRARVGLAIALVAGAQPLGGVFGSLIGGFVVAAIGIHALWLFNGFLIALVCLMLIVFYHEEFTRRPTPHIVTMLRRSLGAVATTPLVVRLFLFSFIATAGYFFTYPYLSTRLLQLAPDANAGVTIGIVFGIAGIATLFATPVWGTVADKVGHERILPIVTFLAACSYIPLYLASSVIGFTAAFFMLSAFSPAINSLTFATIGIETPPDRRNAVMSMLYMPLNAASVVAPLLASVMAAQIQQLFLISAVLVFTAFGWLLVSRRIMPRSA